MREISISIFQVDSKVTNYSIFEQIYITNSITSKVIIINFSQTTNKKKMSVIIS